MTYNVFSGTLNPAQSIRDEAHGRVLVLYGVRYNAINARLKN